MTSRSIVFELDVDGWALLSVVSILMKLCQWMLFFFMSFYHNINLFKVKSC